MHYRGHGSARLFHAHVDGLGCWFRYHGEPGEPGDSGLRTDARIRPRLFVPRPAAGGQDGHLWVHESCRYRYNLDAADLWSGFLSSTEEEYLKKVRQGLDERGLIVPNIAVDEAQIWDDAPEKRDQFHERARAFLNAGRILGARFVRVDAGGEREAREWPREQFDHIVKRYQEYAQYAYDNGFRAGAESHWGPEDYWPSMKKLIAAVDHPGFAICCHIGGWQGTAEERDAADRESAPYVAHTHIARNITEGPLEEKMNNLRHAGYQGYYSVEHLRGRDEYAEVAVELAKVRAVIQGWQASDGGHASASSSAPARNS